MEVVIKSYRNAAGRQLLSIGRADECSSLSFEPAQKASLEVSFQFSFFR
jgi:hypothetical protein